MSFARSSFSLRNLFPPGGGGGRYRVLGGLAWWLVMMAGLALLARLFWDFFLPPQYHAALVLPTAREVAGRLSGKALFSAPLPAASPAVVGAWHLVGVLHSSRRGKARAILRRDGETKPLVLASGATPEPGVKVGKIEARQVTLLINEQAQIIRLPDSRPGAAGASPPEVMRR